MTEGEWNHSDDAGTMLDYLGECRGVAREALDVRFGGDMRNTASLGGSAILHRALHQFYLASCRGIWKLLPQGGEPSRDRDGGAIPCGNGFGR